jgi:tetratricopeptide (TPR) repeat protein
LGIRGSTIDDSMTAVAAPRRLSLGLWLAVFLASLVVAWPGIPAAFIYDDDLGVLQNPALAASGIGDMLFGSPPDSTPYGRPLVILSLALNHRLGGLTPVGYKLFNIALHAANAVVLAAWLTALFGLQADRRTARFLGLSAAVVWAFHPLVTNVSLYTVQRAEGLMVLCYLLTLACGTAALAADSPAGPAVGANATAAVATGVSGLGWQQFAIAACGLGMLCKESMVTAPLAVYLLDAGLFSRSLRGPIARRGWWYAGLAATWGVLAVVMTLWPRSRSVGFTAKVGPWEYLVIQTQILPDYLRKTIWPVPLHLDYSWFPVDGGWACASGLGLAAALAVASWALLQGRVVGYLGVLAFLVLAPTSSLAPVHSMPGAEYRMYLPLACLIAVGLWAWWQALGGREQAFLGSVGLMVIVAAAATHVRARELADPAVHWTQVLERFPDNPRAMNVLGRLKLAKGDLPAARRLFERAIETSPTHSDAYANLGLLEGEAGNLDAAVRLLAESVERWPYSAAAWGNLGVCHARRGDLPRAEEAFRRGLVLAPNDVAANLNLAALLVKQGRLAEAQRCLDTALSRDPANPAALALARRVEAGDGR